MACHLELVSIALMPAGDACEDLDSPLPPGRCRLLAAALGTALGVDQGSAPRSLASEALPTDRCTEAARRRDVMASERRWEVLKEGVQLNVKRALNFSACGRARPARTAPSTAVPGGLLTRKRTEVQLPPAPPQPLDQAFCRHAWSGGGREQWTRKGSTVGKAFNCLTEVFSYRPSSY
jgi:hypothetical protein